MNDDQIRDDILRKLISKAGFVPPVTSLVRPDPRGVEYGKFFAEPTSEPNLIRVKKIDADGVVEYELFFQYVYHFENWAKDNT